MRFSDSVINQTIMILDIFINVYFSILTNAMYRIMALKVVGMLSIKIQKE